MAGGRITLVIASIGGASTSLAFPPSDLPWLAPVGVATLVLTLRDAGPRRAALLGLVYGLGFLGTTLWWLAEALSPFAWAALVAAQGVWLALTAVAAARVRRLHGWPLWVACLLTAAESARSSAPWGGLPWGRLGYSAVDTPWSAWVPLVGIAAAGTVVALLGCLLAYAVEHATRGNLRELALGVVVMGLLTIPSVAGAVAPPTYDASGPFARIAIVQGELPGPGTQVVSNHRLLTETLLGQTQELASANAGRPAPDLVVWPENSTAVDPATDPAAGAAVRAAVAATRAPLLMGAVVDAPDPRRALNQALLWDLGGFQARYTKQRLVPFGEYVPLRPLAERLSARVAAIPRDMVPGGPSEPMRVGSLLIATALCFDVAYDDVLRGQVARGGEVVSVQTSNALFLGSAQLEQQWQVTRARALELGRSVVVSSVNGISGAIAPDGSVLERLPVRVGGSAVVDVPLQTSTTWAVRLGSGPSMLIWVAAGAALTATVARDRPAWSRRRSLTAAVHDAASATDPDRTDTT